MIRSARWYADGDVAARRPYPVVAMIAAILLIASGIYLASGFLFSILFALVGVNRVDSHAAHGSWGFRLLIVPGTMVFWPLLLKRWASGVTEAPEEHNAHRCLARIKP